MRKGQWEPTHRWRVIARDGRVWCETSDEAEARLRMRKGDRLEHLFIYTEHKWQKINIR